MTMQERFRNTAEDAIQAFADRLGAAMANGPAQAHFAKQAGFLGQACRECGAYRLRGAPNCSRCENCGGLGGVFVG